MCVWVLFFNKLNIRIWFKDAQYKFSQRDTKSLVFELRVYIVVWGHFSSLRSVCAEADVHLTCMTVCLLMSAERLFRSDPERHFSARKLHRNQPVDNVHSQGSSYLKVFLIAAGPNLQVEIF